MALTKDEIVKSLRTFRERRDALLHEDVVTFDHTFERFINFCDTDTLAKAVLATVDGKSTEDLNAWWAAATAYNEPKLQFPNDSDEELALRYRLIKAIDGPQYIQNLGFAHQKRKIDDCVELFRTLILRPFAEELSHRIGEAADLATPDARELQAVPLNRIPSPTEIKIFLSHKSVDKPLVYRYQRCLKELGFDPWLDEAAMAAGTNLERGLLLGFEQSCAAVFFLTESFIDEKYLATEIDYAIMQKRRKGNKFAIITPRYSNSVAIPGLLAPYVYRDVADGLEGFTHLLAALPIELGPVRWKSSVVQS